MLSPVIGAVIIAILPKERTDAIKTVAAAAAFLSLLLSFLVFVGYNRELGGFQFTEQFDWIPSLGIGYHVAVDGFSRPRIRHKSLFWSCSSSRLRRDPASTAIAPANRS